MTTIPLDPGDLGAIWTAHGFRPIDGQDVYIAGLKGCPRPSHKNTATDAVERDAQCEPDVMADVGHMFTPSAPASVFHGPIALPPSASLSVPAPLRAACRLHPSKWWSAATYARLCMT